MQHDHVLEKLKVDLLTAYLGSGGGGGGGVGRGVCGKIFASMLLYS